ncbi:MAG: hypothetical protein ABGY41_11840 [Candidatus Poribacteria bacterium]
MRSERTEKNRRYTTREKRVAAYSYAETGSSIKAAKTSGVPDRVIRRWLRGDVAHNHDKTFRRFFRESLEDVEDFALLSEAHASSRQNLRNRDGSVRQRAVDAVYRYILSKRVTKVELGGDLTVDHRGRVETFVAHLPAPGSVSGVESDDGDEEVD